MDIVKVDGRAYFKYMKLAKEALQELIKMYPELGALSGRELEFFESLLTDKTLAGIAKELGITESGAHFHCKNIYKKLQISSRNQLLIKYKKLSP